MKLCVPLLLWIGVTPAAAFRPFPLERTGDQLAALRRNIAEAPNRGPVPAPEKRRFCQNWYDGRLPNCYQVGLTRVHQALEDENCAAALQGPANARMVGEKIRKLKDESPFVFLRGTAALFYYDMFCEDRTFLAVQSNPHLFVISNGDCHPENFGNTLMVNGNISFGVNDFDQAFRAPFTWDLKRGAVAFILACNEKGFDMAVCRQVVDSWLRGYEDIVTGDCKYKNTDRLVEGSRYLDRKEASMVRETMEKVRKRYARVGGHRRWLSKKVDMNKLKFIESDALKPLGAHMIPEFQRVIQNYLYSGVMALVSHPPGHEFWKVLDVARKLGSGTGSLGLDRYWILINGDNNEPRILNMKQVVTGVMEKYLNVHLTDYNQMYRVMAMIKATQPFQNAFFGTAAYNGHYFLIAEQSSFKSSVSIADLDEKAFTDYAYIAGQSQGMLHTNAGCATPECPLHEQAQVDIEACEEVANEFKKEPMLRRSIMEVSFLSAARHIQYHAQLQQAFVKCPYLEKDPVLFLSHEIVGKCENITEPGGL